MVNEEEIKEHLRKILPSERFEHSLRVQSVAVELARHHRADQEKASLAGLLHDCARKMDALELLKLGEKLGMVTDPLERVQPKLLHAPLSAYLARTEFGVKDEEVLEAIAGHTVGRERMELLEKIIYLADHIEPERNFKGVAKIRTLAFTDLDQAVAETCRSMLEHLLEEGLPIYSKTVATRNYYLGKI